MPRAGPSLKSMGSRVNNGLTVRANTLSPTTPTSASGERRLNERGARSRSSGRQLLRHPHRRRDPSTGRSAKKGRCGLEDLDFVARNQRPFDCRVWQSLDCGVEDARDSVRRGTVTPLLRAEPGLGRWRFERCPEGQLPTSVTSRRQARLCVVSCCYRKTYERFGAAVSRAPRE